MEKITLIFFLLLNSVLYSQKLKDLKPISYIDVPTNFSDDFVKKYNSEESLKECEKIYNSSAGKYREFTKEEMEILKYCDEFEGNPWTKKFEGCSWYCGGQIDTIKSNLSYETTKPIHDFDFGTAWITQDTITKNWIEYTFSPYSAKVSNIIIVNGFIRKDEMFYHYSRVKKLKMYINNKPIAYLYLDDNNDGQVFQIKPIGHKKKKNYEPVKYTTWSIKFEIVEIYQGETDKIALTEIYFDGDGHD